jgi:hypothetical protein
MRSVHWRWLAVGLALAGLCGSLQAQEKRDPISDEARLFSKEGLDRARQRIAEIEKDHPFGFGLVVQTVPGLPEAERRKFPALRLLNRYSFFRTWASERAAEAQANGVFVLICTDPKVITVIAWPPEREEYFTWNDCDRLKQTFTRVNARAGPNQALVALIDQLDEILTRKGPPGKAARPGWLVLLILIGALLGLWIVLSLLGYLTRRRTADAVMLDQTPALLGGMFGSVASLPIFDRLLQRPVPVPESAPPSPPDTARVPAEGIISRDNIVMEPPAGRTEDPVTDQP